ncbi:MAG: CgeB family protein, partial [Bacteriovoracaceae bacterium]|nr:CgeB family protein [Bacteriovoracaceae bacterium]
MRIIVLFKRVKSAKPIIEAFLRSGHEIFPIDVDEKTTKEIFQAFNEIDPDFCFAQNFHVCCERSVRFAEELESFFLEKRFPFAIWYTDNPEYYGDAQLRDRWSKKPYPENCLFFINDKSFGSFFKNRELPFFHLPIGADREISPSAASAKRSLGFVGKPIFGSGLREVSLDSIRVGHKRIYLNKISEDLSKLSSHEEEQRLSSSLPIVSTALDRFFDLYYTEKNAYFSAEKSFYDFISKKIPTSLREVVERASKDLNELYSCNQLVCYLFGLTGRGLIVQGSPHWKGYFPNQSEELRRLEENEIYSTYASTKINFTATEWALPTAIHERVFDIFSAGGFPLTDFREMIPESFEKDEIISYRSIEE